MALSNGPREHGCRWDLSSPSLTRTPSLSQKPDQAELLSLSDPPLGSLVAQMVKNLPAIEETQVQSLGGEDPLEEGMETPSSVLAQRIPWTEEPGGLRSVVSQRVAHD